MGNCPFNYFLIVCMPQTYENYLKKKKKDKQNGKKIKN